MFNNIMIERMGEKLRHAEDSNHISKLFLGLFLCSLCTVFAIHSNLGLSPWAVFHQGIAGKAGITFGQASIGCSFIIILIVSKMGLNIGFGTICNMIFTGVFVDLLEVLKVIPDAANIRQGVMMMCLSMLFNALGSYLYISCGMGCGPRDGLMSVLTQKSRLPVGIIRGMIELTVFLAGWKLGGQIGIGTLLNVLGIGIFVNVVYRIMEFDVTEVRHQTLRDSMQSMKKGSAKIFERSTK